MVNKKLLLFLVMAVLCSGSHAFAASSRSDAQGPDAKYFNGTTESGTHRLTNSGILKAFMCMGGIESDRQWVRDILFYSDGAICLNFSGRREGNFYDLSGLEQAMGTTLDLRPNSSVVSGGAYSLDTQLLINPLAAKWVAENFTGLKKRSRELYEFAQNIYNKNNGVARSFVYAYDYLTQYDDYEKQLQAYKEAVADGMNMLDFLQRFKPAKDQGYDNRLDDFDGEGWIGYDDGYSRFRFAVGFWLRRGIDGSLYAFKELMEKMMQDYDADWYANRFKTRPRNLKLKS